jgi:hypothetical protein
VDQTKVVKKIFESKFEGRSKVGRHTLVCLEDADNDLRELMVKRWSQKTNNTEKLMSVVKKVKVLIVP